jgi:hypothetical protein
MERVIGAGSEDGWWGLAALSMVGVSVPLFSTHPVCASLDDPLSGFAAKRVKQFIFLI